MIKIISKNLNEQNKEYFNYKNKSSKIKEVNWYNLPESAKLKLSKFPSNIKILGNIISVRRLKESKDKMRNSNNIFAIKR